MKLDSYIAFLSQAQTIDGQFPGYASPDTQDYSQNVKQPTSFFTSLILECLNDVPGTQEIRQNAADWLLKQRSETWSWNYWQKNSKNRQQIPYPDDLDDTACALVALANFNPLLVDGQALGSLAQHLIRAEFRTGGPYRTWLTDANSPDGRSDIDPAVNANIGYFLETQQVRLRPLNCYFDDLIESGQLESAYYLGTAPTLYFLARWYKGPKLSKLRQFVINELTKSIKSVHPLNMALMLTAACHLKVDEEHMRVAATCLQQLAPDSRWPAVGMYRDPTMGGQPFYAGSETLTTAFALQALSLVQKVKKKTAKTERSPSQQQILNHAKSLSLQLPNKLSELYNEHASSLINRDADGQICHMAEAAASASGLKTNNKVLQSLNVANLNGWLAYSIYDDIMDDGSGIELLGLANAAQRLAWRQFYGSVNDGGFRKQLRTTFDLIDEANTWEFNNCRGKVSRGHLVVRDWPYYGNYQILAHKSLGHSLTAQAVYCLAGYSLGGIRQKALLNYFQHYLIARQLNDDAHDWQTDLAKGRLSPVVCLLLNSYGRQSYYKIDQEMRPLHALFWHKVIDQVVGLINYHIKLSRKFLTDLQISSSHDFYKWLDTLNHATLTALKERNESLKFWRYLSNGRSAETV